MQHKMKQPDQTICNQLISQLFIELRESGYSDESITTAAMEELYCGVLEPNDVEPVIEKIRNARNEAFGGTWDECIQRNAEFELPRPKFVQAMVTISERALRGETTGAPSSPCVWVINEH